jgi:hypothetical protein
MLSTQRAYVFCIRIIRASLISLCAIQRLVFQMEEYFVLCEVRNKCINCVYIEVKIICLKANILYEGRC